MQFSNRTKRILLIIFAITLVKPINSYAKPCKPTDPLGNNTGNQCHPFPPHPGLNSDSFMTGVGRPIRRLPTVSNPEGTVIIPSSAGFWTGSKTSGSTRTIRNSDGNSYQFSK